MDDHIINPVGISIMVDKRENTHFESNSLPASIKYTFDKKDAYISERKHASNECKTTSNRIKHWI